MTAAAGALRIESLDDIGEEAELQSFARAHEPAAAPGAANGTDAGAKRRQFAYSRDPNERVALNKDAMELEIKQMRGFNREVYESRVRQKYLEERVCRALYTQKLAWRRHEKLDVQRIRQQERIAREVAAKTPYLRDKAREEQRKQMEDNERARGAPRFHDIASIEERLANANLLARGVAPSDRVAHPATAYELTVRETRRLPPNGSLLNPRNQCTSPLPDRSLLLPYEYPPDDEEGGGGAKSVQTLRVLVAQLVPLFDVKRNADLVAERSGRPRPRLLDALREHLTMRGLREVEVRGHMYMRAPVHGYAYAGACARWRCADTCTCVHMCMGMHMQGPARGGGARTHVHACTCAWVCICRGLREVEVRARARVPACLHAHACICTCMRMPAYAHAHAYTRAHMRACLHTGAGEAR